LITDSIEDEVSVTVSATTRPADGKEEGKVDKTSVHIDEVENGEEAVEAEKSTNHVLGKDCLKNIRHREENLKLFNSYVNFFFKIC